MAYSAHLVRERFAGRENPSVTVSAIIVTRGDVSLDKIIGQDWPDSVGEILVHDNSVEIDLSVYGRYAAVETAKNPIIFVQDDDVLLPRESLETILSRLTVSDPHAVVCNMPARFRDQPQYERGDSALVGFGACFHRDAPKRAFEKFVAPADGFNLASGPWFHRTCDVTFTALTPRVLVDVPYEDLPHAHAENRMWKQPQHVEERMRMLELVRKVRDAG